MACASRSRTRALRYRSDGDDEVPFVIIGMWILDAASAILRGALRSLRCVTGETRDGFPSREKRQRGIKRFVKGRNLGVISSPVRGRAGRGGGADPRERGVRRYVISCVGCSRGSQDSKMIDERPVPRIFTQALGKTSSSHSTNDCLVRDTVSIFTVCRQPTTTTTTTTTTTISGGL